MSKAKKILEDFAKSPTTTTLETMETLVAYARGLELLVNENAPTLRDRFAIAALGGLCVDPKKPIILHIVEDAYKIADAMMEVRTKQPE